MFVVGCPSAGVSDAVGATERKASAPTAKIRTPSADSLHLHSFVGHAPANVIILVVVNLS